MGFNSGFKGLMWYRKIIIVCFDSHTKQIHCMETADFMKDNYDGTHNNHLHLKG